MAARQEALTALEIRALESIAEFDATLRLQKLIWGFDERDTVASRLFGVIQHAGGSALGAFLGGELVGYTLALAAFKPDRKPHWHSHMAGVDPSMHNLGIGHRLKLRQREEALAAGLDLIEWTFDPLQPRNAFFNIEKLGAEAVAYLPDFYGVTSSALHGSLPTDRLVAAWRLQDRAVADRAGGALFETRRGAVRIEVPAGVLALPPGEALEIQERVRRQFQAAFRDGLRAVGFERTAAGGTYHLDRAVAAGAPARRAAIR